ncbi:glycosyltransferase family 32 protein [Ruminococcus albus]|jgi:hypothetical protein|uniref:glycosyltransferase family 32 protein n=1 Tax=Ruminococcus albus TaxID=1264 RepID=UPI0004BAE24D|nr:glycosyltransferase [Ruminococcus albus]
MNTIHYCWFGRNPKPNLIIKCIDSWKNKCPNYNIIEWNEDNFDINCCNYVREAYEAKKWAFVSDYCRFYVLFHYGGIYLDTDVELLKSLDNLSDAFVGFESPQQVNSGLVRGANKGDSICKKMLDSYQNDCFLNDDGTYNLVTVCERETGILREYGLKLNNQLQLIENTTIYPSEYFNPTEIGTGKINISANTISIHHYAASWVDSNTRLRAKIYRTISRLFGVKFAERIRKMRRLVK